MHWHSFFKGSSFVTSGFLIGKVIQRYFSSADSLDSCTNILSKMLGLDKPLNRIADELHFSKSNATIILTGLAGIGCLHFYSSYQPSREDPPLQPRR